MKIDPVTYQNAQPFPHVVIEHAIDPLILSQAIGHFAQPSGADPIPVMKTILSQLTGELFVRFLRRLTGVQTLVADSGCSEGGPVSWEPGAREDARAGVGEHPVTGLPRRICLQLFLNQDWPESYGGELELRDPVRNAKITPGANRLVVFDIGPANLYGVSQVTCLPGMSRKGIIVFYYLGHSFTE